jgi:hypothetical protein
MNKLMDQNSDKQRQLEEMSCFKSRNTSARVKSEVQLETLNI